MTDLTRRAALGALAAGALGASMLDQGAARAQENEIAFGVISTEGSQNLRSQWEPFLADMAKQTGLKVTGFYASDYAGVIEAMRFNKVQVAWFGNASAMQAVDRANGEIFVQKTYADGSRGYYSLLIVNRDGPIKSFEQLLREPGKYNFGNGDPNSTSGFLIPSYYAWAKNNIDVRSFFRNVVTGNHEANLLAVALGRVDVATNNTEDLEKFQKQQPERAALIREIWRSPIIPADPMVWRADLPEPVKQKMRAFFLSYGRDRPGADPAREREILQKMGGWGEFIPSSNAQLLPIRQVAAFRQKLAVQNDTTLSAEEKQKKLAELDARLAELDRELTAAQRNPAR
ncbi:MAG TPA: phosphonate ABC transporter substrate-binding protein [Crenalkalicoccus sp.]|jgi:phosphonate transport system substrate-binding protein|nr:phosphonate ABC transporter substrate-binding protein [Crenalkalicoccus sp.]